MIDLDAADIDYITDRLAYLPNIFARLFLRAGRSSFVRSLRHLPRIGVAPRSLPHRLREVYGTQVAWHRV